MSTAIEFIQNRSCHVILKKLLVDLSGNAIPLEDLEPLLIFSKQIRNWHINYLVCKHITYYITLNQNVALFLKIAQEHTFRTEAIVIATIYLNQTLDLNPEIIQAVLKLASSDLESDLYTLQLYEAISNKFRNTEISIDFTAFMELNFTDSEMKRKHYSLIYDISKHFSVTILPRLSFYTILQNPKEFSPAGVILSLRACGKTLSPEIMSKLMTPSYIPELYNTLLEDDEYLIDAVIYLLDLSEDIQTFELLPNNVIYNYLEAINWDYSLIVDYIINPKSCIFNLLLKISTKIFYTNPYSIYIYFDELHEERSENIVQFLSNLYSMLKDLSNKSLIPYDISPLLNKLIRYSKYS